MKVYIAYGWPEGKRHSVLLKRALVKADYELTNRQENADIVIAHSAGCYRLSSEPKNKLVLLVGLPNWPHKPLHKATWQKVRLEIKNRYWYRKTLLNVFYALHIRTTFKAWRALKSKLIPLAEDKRVVLIHNKQDAYMHDNTGRAMAARRGWEYVDLDGQHDDLWQNPKPYIEIVNSIVGSNSTKLHKQHP